MSFMCRSTFFTRSILDFFIFTDFLQMIPFSNVTPAINFSHVIFSYIRFIFFSRVTFIQGSFIFSRHLYTIHFHVWYFHVIHFMLLTWFIYFHMVFTSDSFTFTRQDFTRDSRMIFTLSVSFFCFHCTPDSFTLVIFTWFIYFHVFIFVKWFIYFQMWFSHTVHIFSCRLILFTWYHVSSWIHTCSFSCTMLKHTFLFINLMLACEISMIFPKW